MNIHEYECSQETKPHGQDNFPFDIYLCSIPIDFTIVPTHWHNAMEIIYIKKGRGTINVDLSPFQVSEGDIIVVPPGQLHSIEQQSDYSMEYENIIFKLSMLMAPQEDSAYETWKDSPRHLIYKKLSPVPRFVRLPQRYRLHLPGFCLWISARHQRTTVFLLLRTLKVLSQRSFPRPQQISRPFKRASQICGD